jgi:hypothetical protein
MIRSFSFISWNVRGLGDSEKCGDVLYNLTIAKPSFVVMKETKISNLLRLLKNALSGHPGFLPVWYFTQLVLLEGSLLPMIQHSAN